MRKKYNIPNYQFGIPYEAWIQRAHDKIYEMTLKKGQRHVGDISIILYIFNIY